MNTKKLTSLALGGVLAASAIGVVTAPAAAADQDGYQYVTCSYYVWSESGWNGTRAFDEEDMFEGSTWLRNGEWIRAYRDLYSQAYGEELVLRMTAWGQFVDDDVLFSEQNCTGG